MTLTKADLTKAARHRSSLSCNHVSLLIDTLLEIIKKTLESGQDISISRFGKFQVKDKKPRYGRNSATGNDLPVDTRRFVAFRCSAVFKEKLNI